MHTVQRPTTESKARTGMSRTQFWFCCNRLVFAYETAAEVSRL